MQKRTIRKSSKSALYYNSGSDTHRLILSGNIETNPGPMNPDNKHTKPKSDGLPSSTSQLCHKTVQINSKSLMSIHCRCFVQLQSSTLKAIHITKNSSKAHEWVCENCYFKELPFSRMREFQEITVTFPATDDIIECENINISSF